MRCWTALRLAVQIEAERGIAERLNSSRDAEPKVGPTASVGTCPIKFRGSLNANDTHWLPVQIRLYKASEELKDLTLEEIKDLVLRYWYNDGSVGRFQRLKVTISKCGLACHYVIRSLSYRRSGGVMHPSFVGTAASDRQVQIPQRS